MSTSPITKRFILEDLKVVDKLASILNSNKRKKRQTANRYERQGVAITIQ